MINYFQRFTDITHCVKSDVFGVILVGFLPHSDWIPTRITPNNSAKLFTKWQIFRQIFSKQILYWNFKMELCLNRGLVWEFLCWKLCSLCFIKLKSVEYSYNSEPRPGSSRISRSQKHQNKMDLNVLNLIYFLILKKRALTLFSLIERSWTWYCQLRFVSIFAHRYLTAFKKFYLLQW